VLGKRNCTLRYHRTPLVRAFAQCVAHAPAAREFRLSKFEIAQRAKLVFDLAALDRLHRNTAGKRQPFSSAMSVWSNLFLMSPEGIFRTAFFENTRGLICINFFCGQGARAPPLAAALRRYRRGRITEQHVESRCNFRVEMSQQKRRFGMKYFSTVWR